MPNGVRLLILVGVAFIVEPCVVAKKYNVTVGYLPCVTGDSRNMQGLAVSGAVSMAIEEVNNSTELLPDVNLLLEWNDTKCDTVIATRLVTDMSGSGVVAFFGPEGRCQTEAIIAQSRNLPMISYKCSDYQTSTLSNFIRLNPPERQATKSVLSLLRYYRWNKFSILYEESWAQAALTLEAHANDKNMTVIHRRLFTDPFTCCEERKECCDLGFWHKLIQETKNRTRIYVVLGSISNLIEIMTAMESQQLFKNGEYMVIFVDMMPYTPKDSLKYLIKTEDRGMHNLICPNTPRLQKRAQSLLVVVSSKLDSSYENFIRKVRKFTAQEPFKFHRPSVFDTKFLKFVSIYAAYLYDSVKLYATALHSLIEEDTTQRNETLTYERLMNVATNGSRIVARMITNTPFKSVSGTSIRFDERRDSEGNFSVLAFKPVLDVNNKDNNNCNYTMIPVGYFRHSVTEFPEYKLNPRLTIDWPDSVKPEDEPSCGFLNEKCPKDDSQITSIVAIGMIVFTLLCIVFCLFYIVIKVKTSKLRKQRTDCLLFK